MTVREWFRVMRAGDKVRDGQQLIGVQIQIENAIERWEIFNRYPKPFNEPGYMLALDDRRRGRFFEFVNLVEVLRKQIDWSYETFGPGPRTGGCVAHIRKELAEIEREPLDAEEWIDVAMIALDGAWRTGKTADEIARLYTDKLLRNQRRYWPDWRDKRQDEAIEHKRTAGDGPDETTITVRHEYVKRPPNYDALRAEGKS